MDIDLFKQVVALLLPEMDDPSARKPLVESALLGSPVLRKIKWDGSADTFTKQLVRLLDEFGQIATGRPAIVALLEETRTQVGTDRQTRIDELLAQLQSPITQPAPSHDSSQATRISEGRSTVVAGQIPQAYTPPTATAVSDRKPESQAPRTEDSAARPHPTINTPRWPRLQPFRPRMLVMKGGGVKGIAYVGALTALEEYGYHFDHFVGTSAGAISAALLAVGYGANELGGVLEKTNFKEFKDGWFLPALLLLPFRKGLYRGEAFRVWLEKLLRAKYPKYGRAIEIQFKHLNEADGAARRLTVFASRKGRTAYSFDSANPRDSETAVSFACRCSMAIPYFFMPEKIEGEWVVDGGMQSNYPIDALLKYFPTLRDNSNFIGLYLGSKDVAMRGKWMLLNLFSIWQESGDEEAKQEFIDRTIVIDPRPVATTDFSLSPNDVKFLLAEGRASALHWLYHWSDEHKPPLDMVEAAARESESLRDLIINERWWKFWPKLAAGILLLALPIIGLAYYYFQQ